MVVLVDMCGRGWDEANDDSHCVTRASWANTMQGAEPWAGAWPVQVGGLAHYPPLPEDHGWGVAPTPTPLQGCISHLTLNGQVRIRTACHFYITNTQNVDGIQEPSSNMEGLFLFVFLRVIHHS